MDTDQEMRTLRERYYTRLDWLKLVAGEAAEMKFMHAKIAVPPYSGNYVSGISWIPGGCRTLIELLDQLKDGMAVPLVDVTSYYGHGRSWPCGMRIENGRLVDTWPEQ